MTPLVLNNRALMFTVDVKQQYNNNNQMQWLYSKL